MKQYGNFSWYENVNEISQNESDSDIDNNPPLGGEELNENENSQIPHVPSKGTENGVPVRELETCKEMRRKRRGPRRRIKDKSIYERKRLARKRAEEREAERASRGGKTAFGATQDWDWIFRNRYRNAQIAARKKGIDYLPYDVYNALWEAAGTVEAPWGEVLDARKMQTKFYDERLRTMMIRRIEDSDHGFTRGNVAIVLLKGKFRNHTVPDIQPEIYQELASWEENGDILDRYGKVVCNLV